MAPARPMAAAEALSSWDSRSSAHAAGDAADLSACTSGRIVPASTMVALFSSQMERLSSAVTPCSCSSGSACDSSLTSGGARLRGGRGLHLFAVVSSREDKVGG
jgi:hypothetical protein